MRRLTNIMDKEPPMSSRDAMVAALELIAKARLENDASAEELRERLDRCAKIAVKALLYTKDAYGA